jgi:hypothetical protein
VRFTEMEYALPRAIATEALRAMKAAAERFDVSFPLELRFTAGDDALLSPTGGEDTAFVAVHVFRGMAWEPYFRAVEAIADAHGGRPHWGKRHFQTAATLAPAVPGVACLPGGARAAGPRRRLRERLRRPGARTRGRGLGPARRHVAGLGCARSRTAASSASPIAAAASPTSLPCDDEWRGDRDGVAQRADEHAAVAGVGEDPRRQVGPLAQRVGSMATAPSAPMPARTSPAKSWPASGRSAAAISSSSSRPRISSSSRSRMSRLAMAAAQQVGCAL